MNALELKALTKTYPNFRLDSLDLVLPSGCILGLIGENGAGKSTTIKLILGLIQRDGGSIRILGQEQEQALPLIKQDIGVVLDEVGIPGCFNTKQVGNVMRHTYSRWDDALYSHYLKRLSLPSDKSFQEFSRGMKMKLGIAVALSHHPKLLILDEATSGLDPVVRDDVLEIFNDFTRNETHSILMSSHIVSDLEKICDYLAFLHEGKLLLMEEKDRLMEEYGIVRGSVQQIAALPSSAVIAQKCSPYGAEALVLREQVPANQTLSPVGVEELFVFLVKGRNEG